MHSSRLLVLFAAVAALPATSPAQNVISARAGLVHLADGRVLLDEKPIVPKITQFTEVKENSRLRTERGRAEVLLSPGVFLRLGEDSAIVMQSTRLTDVRFRLAAGSAVVEADELGRDIAITVLAGQREIRIERTGLYRFDVPEGEAPRLRVFAGEALIGSLRVKSNKEVTLDDLVVSKFNPEDTDPLDRWSRRRANYVAMASVSASRMAWERGFALTGSSWMWNPYFGMFGFLPYRGVAMSTYGFGFYSPRTVRVLYNPPVYTPPPMGGGMSARPSYNASYGYSTVPHTSGGASGVVAASPSSPAAGGGNMSRGAATSGGPARR